MAYYLVTFGRGPGWDPARGRREQAGWAAHAAFMDALVDDGFVLAGGPLGENVDSGAAALAVVADDAQEVRARLAADPWHDIILTVDSVEPWALWLVGRRFGPGQDV